LILIKQVRLTSFKMRPVRLDWRCAPKQHCNPLPLSINKQEIAMRAHQVMTRSVITVLPGTSIKEAARKMVENHISGLPVVDASGALVGIVTEGDFLRRSEIGTQHKRPSWLAYFLSPSVSADKYIHERGRKVQDIMTRKLVTADEDMPLDELVRLMEKNRVKRAPVLRSNELVGIVTRANLLRALASMGRDVPDPTADDDHIRNRIIRVVEATDWQPIGFQVAVRNGVVHLHGLITNESSRRASIVAAENTEGVKEVHDHLCLVDTYSGFYLESPEDMKQTS
jgi:CBS domain-containing protein